MSGANPHLLPEFEEAAYFAMLGEWWEFISKRAESVKRSPTMQRHDVVQMYRDWFKFGKQVSEHEHRRRLGLGSAMLNGLRSQAMKNIPDKHLWLAVVFLIGQYEPEWMQVWHANMQMGLQ